MKAIRYLVFVMACLGIIWSGLLLKQFNRRPFFTASSPNQELNIEFFEHQKLAIPLSPKTIPFVAYDSKSGQITTGVLDHLDGYGLTFAEEFPHSDWIDDSILRFSRPGWNPTNETDTVTIRNKSDKAVRYLVLKAWDRYLLLGLEAGEKVILNVPHSRWQGWIQAQGMFDDRSSIHRSEMSFSNESKLPAPLRFCVTITNAGALVQSPIIKGWSFQDASIPIETDCEK